MVPVTGFSSLRRAARLFWQPLEPERAAALADRWNSLDPELRTPWQAFGRKMTGCSATIGMLPRCDFSCTGCYLGDDANSSLPFPIEEVFAQLDRIRAWTGPKGNVQLTDGEVTLRDEAELLAILRRAREIGLIPMLMTHGDSFRKRPGLLERLMVDGGLREVSIHVDTTMRGRLGYRDAKREEDLDPLRDEFARLIREARRSTGIPLRAATTMTVTSDNLAGVAGVVNWCARNRDVFRMLSLQPLADVGRTRSGLAGVDVDRLWESVAEGLVPWAADVGDGGPIHVGHPACNRVASFLCVETRSGARMLKTIRADEDDDREFLEALDATGLMGVAYRDDAPLDRWARRSGAALRGLPFVLGPARRFIGRRLQAAGASYPKVLAGLATGRVRIDGFSIVSHHFMGRTEVATPLGRERLDACVFRLPVGGEMISMCQVNLLGARESAYAAGSSTLLTIGGELPHETHPRIPEPRERGEAEHPPMHAG